jgi:hypothetical protein
MWTMPPTDAQPVGDEDERGAQRRCPELSVDAEVGAKVSP